MNIAIFVSGSGTNCENLIRHFEHSDAVKCALVVSNKPDAYALVRAERLGVPTAIAGKPKLGNPDEMLPLLREYGIDFIVLAGFLPLIPTYLIDAFPRRIINLHPALLPKFGGREGSRRERDRHDGPLRLARLRRRRDYCPVPHTHLSGGHGR